MYRPYVDSVRHHIITSQTHYKFIKFKQRKSFGDGVWISLALNFTFLFLLVLVSIEKIYQTLKTVFDIFPNNSKFVKNTPLHVVFLTLLWSNTVFRV